MVEDLGGKPADLGKATGFYQQGMVPELAACYLLAAVTDRSPMGVTNWPCRLLHVPWNLLARRPFNIQSLIWY